jgi:hypothetical protein
MAWFDNIDGETKKSGVVRFRVAKGDLWKAIRAKCMDCSTFSYTEVTLCPVEECSLFPYRFGKGMTDAALKKKVRDALGDDDREKKEVENEDVKPEIIVRRPDIPKARRKRRVAK